MGLPGRHARRPRGGGVPRLRGARLGRRAADLPARRPARARAWSSSGRSRTPTQEAVDAGRARATCPTGYRHVFDGVDDRDQAGLAGARGHRGAAPDGGLRRRGQQRRPQGRARAGDDRRPPVRRRPRPDLPRRAQAAHRAVGLARRAAAPTRSRAGVRRRRATRCDGDAGRRARRAASPTSRSRRLARRCRPAAARAARLPAPRGELAARSRGRPSEPRPIETPDARCRRLPRMRAWPAPGRARPSPCTGPPVRSTTPPPAAWSTTRPDGPARLYVCGITPYDATHMGHAATYVGFDLLNRAWRNAGHEVDLRPERHRRRRPAARAGRQGRRRLASSWPSARPSCSARTWRRCGCCRPTHYVGAVESIPLVIDLIERLQDAGVGLPGRGRPLLLGDRRPGVRRGVRAGPRRRCSRIFAERGGDPDRAGQEGPARLRRVARPSDRASRRWDSPFGPGRPGWHIECTAIALRAPRRRLRRAGRRQRPGLPAPRDVRRPRAGRRPGDAVRPGLRARRDGRPTTARRCRSRKGNLVFVSALRNSDVDPMAIRLALLRHHYRTDWEWTDDQLWDAVDTARPLAPGARARRRRPGRAGRRARCSPRSPTTSTPRARSPPSRPGWTPPSAPTGLADTCDPRGRRARCAPLLGRRARAGAC